MVRNKTFFYEFFLRAEKIIIFLVWALLESNSVFVKTFKQSKLIFESFDGACILTSLDKFGDPRFSQNAGLR